MSGIKRRACFYSLLFTLMGCVRAELQFLERNEGESVVFSCVVEKRDPSPFGVYLKRSWLHNSEVLFMHTKDNFTASNSYEKRTSVSGDPSSHVLNVTISQLKVSDTDRYFCEFHVPNPLSEDLQLKGNNEFFLLVQPDTVSSVDFGLVQTCAGGSAVLPCVPPRVEALAVEGVSLKRQMGRLAPVEVLYHSYHRGARGPISSSSSSVFPDERVQLSLAHGPGGMTYNLTMLQLQPEESALYSCTLLLRGLPDSSTRLGRQMSFVSVQAECGCSGYSTLLYALSAGVAVLLFLVLLIGCVVCQQGKARRKVKSHPQAPIYEEMAGVHAESQKLATYHLEEMSSSENKSSHMKKSCPENHYERPIGGPRRVSP